MYLQLVQCFTCSVFTVCAVCNVILIISIIIIIRYGCLLSQAFIIIIIIIITDIIRYSKSANLFCMSTYVEHQLHSCYMRIFYISIF